eukprot:TRINITY_DN8089_c0_g1_i2.p1 TRINITY_DN8089_c0_g1~~TRINITY_DN8089_c0_g1_i2.p1  ORF type:complete len:175 (+),score=42.55 TRINITY_DN8089_c0_g1_i2:69-527(+)
MYGGYGYGMPSATISGPDMNGNGIPDQLEGRPMYGAPMMGPPMMGGMGYGAPMMGAPMMGGAPMGYGAPPMMGGGYGGPGMYGPGRPGSVMQACYNNGLDCTDWNGDGIPDRMQGTGSRLMAKLMPDRNGDGIPDFLQGRRAHYRPGAPGYY